MADKRNIAGAAPKKANQSKDDNADSFQDRRPKRLDVMQAIFGECLCADTVTLFTKSSKYPVAQFAMLDGIECIALGAVTDEQSARERVMRTVSLIITDTERLISLGYLVDGPPPSSELSSEKKRGDQESILIQYKKITESLPYEVWKRKNTDQSQKGRRGGYGEFTLPLAIGSAVEHLKVCNPFTRCLLYN